MTSNPTLTVPSLAARKAALAAHPVYGAIDSIAALRTFMAHHVACVWDFMSLLKSLQRDLAPTATPWTPPADAEAARLINEIVLDEESDLLPHRGAHGSHFAWYLDAMCELQVDTRPMTNALAAILAGTPAPTAMRAAGVPAAACEFTATTLGFVTEPLAVRAAVFLHGREEVIPQMFLPLVRALQERGIACDRLLGYLQRHIEVDGGAHGAHAAKLLERLVTATPQHRHRAEQAALAALAARERLWDAVVTALGTERARA